jgi:hypothetical protein
MIYAVNVWDGEYKECVRYFMHKEHAEKFADSMNISFAKIWMYQLTITEFEDDFTYLPLLSSLLDIIGKNHGNCKILHRIEDTEDYLKCKSEFCTIEQLHEALKVGRNFNSHIRVPFKYITADVVKELPHAWAIFQESCCSESNGEQVVIFKDTVAELYIILNACRFGAYDAISNESLLRVYSSALSKDRRRARCTVVAEPVFLTDTPFVATESMLQLHANVRKDALAKLDTREA